MKLYMLGHVGKPLRIFSTQSKLHERYDTGAAQGPCLCPSFWSLVLFCVKWLLWSRNSLEKRAHLMRTAALSFAEAKLVALQMLNVFHGASCACSQRLPSTDGSGLR